MSNNKLDNFNWGSSQGWFKDEIRKEFIDRGGQYQVEFKVEDGDIVFDDVDHRPTLHIDVADRDDDGDDDDEVKPLTPVDKLKEDLDL